MPRVAAFKALYDGTAARLRPDPLYRLAVAAGLPESEAEELRNARESAIAEESASRGEL